jgi:beta-lactamase class A
LQYQPSGVALSANDVAGQMIRISDNTCTNMMIDSLGGVDALNRRLAHLGLVETRIRHWLPDLSGTNTISPYEMVTILYNLENRQVVSDDVRQNGIDILKSTHNRRLLVTPLPPEAVVAHKTGDIGTSLGDSGIIYMPDGRKYILSIQVERPYNDYTARDMVQLASRLIYDYIAQTPASPLPSPDDVNLLSGRASSPAP